CCHHLTLLRVTFSAANVSNCCHRLLLPPSSSTVGVACYHRATSSTVVAPMISKEIPLAISDRPSSN
ncbi:hypothetical protein CDAR_505621, partial [Caerostris darwini]